GVPPFRLGSGRRRGGPVRPQDAVGDDDGRLSPHAGQSGLPRGSETLFADGAKLQPVLSGHGLLGSGPAGAGGAKRRPVPRRPGGGKSGGGGAPRTSVRRARPLRFPAGRLAGSPGSAQTGAVRPEGAA